MLLQLVFFINLLLYSIIVSQSFMYMIALRNVQEQLNAAAYIQLRKLIDQNFLRKFKPVMYAALVSGLVLIVLCFIDGSEFLRIASVIAYLALLTDVALTVKGDLPINAIINSWSEENYPADWSSYRSKWLQYFSGRQAANISGFLVLIATAVFA
jgi:hypothetical protein